MSWLSRLPIMAFLSILLTAGGCDRPKEPATVSPTEPAVERTFPQVIVPDEVQGQWEAVRISVVDQETGSREIFTVRIGSTVFVEDAQLSITVLYFLPAFIMEGTRMTSAGNRTSNPAAQVVIQEKDEEIFRGWLFSLYPGVHSFKHSRYNFALVDFVPIGKKEVDKRG